MSERYAPWSGPDSVDRSLPSVPLRFMLAYALAQYTAWLAVLAPVILTIALKVSRFTSGTEKGAYLSMILAVGAFGAMVAAPVWGAVSDRTRSRFGRRKLWMAIGCAALLAGTLILAFSTSILGLGIGWMICQLGSNAAQAPLNAVLPDVVPEHQRGRMSALLGITINLALVSAAFLTQYTVGSDLAMFLVPWLPYPLALVLLFASFEDRPARTEMSPFRLIDVPRMFWVDPVRYPDFAWAFVSRFLLFLASAFFLTYQLYFLTDHVHLSGDVAVRGIFIGTLITTALSLALTPLGGWLSDRIGRRKPLVFGAGMIAAAGLLAIGSAATFDAFLVSAAIYGTGAAVYYAVDIALCVAVLPNPENAAKDMAVLQIANSLPQSLAPTIAPLFLAIGPGREPNYAALFISAALIALVGASAVLPIRKSR